MPAGFYVWCFLLQVPGGCLYPGARGRGSLATRAAVRSAPGAGLPLPLEPGPRETLEPKKPSLVSREVGAPGRFPLHPTSHPLLQPSHPSWVQTPSCTELLTASRPSRGAGIFRDLSLRRDAKRMNLKREKCQREALWTLNLRRARDLLPQPSSP